MILDTSSSGNKFQFGCLFLSCVPRLLNCLPHKIVNVLGLLARYNLVINSFYKYSTVKDID
jgi:hypothetical protein